MTGSLPSGRLNGSLVKRDLPPSVPNGARRINSCEYCVCVSSRLSAAYACLRGERVSVLISYLYHVLLLFRLLRNETEDDRSSQNTEIIRHTRSRRNRGSFPGVSTARNIWSNLEHTRETLPVMFSLAKAWCLGVARETSRFETWSEPYYRCCQIFNQPDFFISFCWWYAWISKDLIYLHDFYGTMICELWCSWPANVTVHGSDVQCCAS